MAIAGTLGVATYLALFLAQDGLVRRSIADFGLAARSLLADSKPGGQATR